MDTIYSNHYHLKAYFFTTKTYPKTPDSWQKSRSCCVL